MLTTEVKRVVAYKNNCVTKHYNVALLYITFSADCCK